MNDSDAPNMVYLLLCLVLVSSALLGRQLPLKQTAKMMLAWVAIIGSAFTLFTFRGDFAMFGTRLRAEALGTTPMTQTNDALVLTRANDGHFYAEASVNGQTARFLIDTGASKTTVDRSLADAAGLETGNAVDVVDTANGTTLMKKSVAQSFVVGSILRSDMPVSVSPQTGLNIIGMDFLSSLHGWRVEGNRLLLQP